MRSVNMKQNGYLRHSESCSGTLVPGSNFLKKCGYNTSAVIFISALSNLHLCDACGCTLMYCNMCGENMWRNLVLNSLYLTNLMDHITARHSSLRKCKNHNYNLGCTVFEYMDDRIIESERTNAATKGPFNITINKETSNIRVCIVNLTIAEQNPSILFIKPVDGKRIVDKLIQKYEEHFYSPDSGITFQLFRYIGGMVFDHFGNVGEGIRGLLDIFIDCDYECSICGGEYDAGFPSVEMVAEHIMLAHRDPIPN